jgi:uncharacterized protein
MISLTAQWTFLPGQEARGLRALKRLAREVLAQEPGTLVYLLHTPDAKRGSLPPPSPQTLLFFEVYADEKAFLAHVNGPLFTGFLKRYRDCFVAPFTPPGQEPSPFMVLQFLKREAGFVR